MRNLKARSNLDSALRQLGDSPIKVSHAVDKDRLIALEMPGQQQRRRIRIQANHRNPGTERLNRKYELAAQPAREVLHVRGDVVARQIHELQPLEQDNQRLVVILPACDLEPRR